MKRFTDKEKRLSKYAACEYLNVSRATFDNYVREGKLPRGKHEIGFKELSWSKKELDEFVKKCRTTQGLCSNPNSRIMQQSKLKDCLIALIEFIEVIRRRKYDNPKEEMEQEGKAITINQYGASLVAINSKRGSSIIHEAEHIKNSIWRYIGYTPQEDNDEVDAYLITYIYNKCILQA